MDSSAMENKSRENSDMENSDIKSNANYQNGLKVRTEVMGEAHGKMTQYCHANTAH